nr:hypothetical protein [Mycobacterium heidelbergense]
MSIGRGGAPGAAQTLVGSADAISGASGAMAPRISVTVAEGTPVG